ncbi:MAB_1171c family putative transporter [Actinocorallia populi]|uniref:MAB_1171c family putative transporter n=1 Tax=Actinocorallia populi TaxID=2079200 RepID=UPI000D08FE26|nr:MAB_1171c family putative transporter [Actinocorallia populi]
MLRSALYITCAVAMTAWFLYKLRYLRTRWESPRLWALCAAILSTAVTLWLAAPSNVLWVDRSTGIPNLATLLVAACQTVSGGVYLTLALLWRHPFREAWSLVRWIVLACPLCVLALSALFFASSTPVERTEDFNTYYAGQPTVAVFSLLWLSWVLTGHAVLAYWCFRWTREPDYAAFPWLRRGLWVYGAYGVDVALFPLVGILAILARRTGLADLDALYKATGPVAALGGVLLLTAALTLPTFGPKLEPAAAWVARWRLYRRLRPLHRELAKVAPELVYTSPGRRFDPYHRTRRMVLELSDWRWSLAPLFDPEVARLAERRGRGAGYAGERLAAVVEAAQLRNALETWSRGERGVAADRSGEEVRDGALGTELAWWVRVAEAFSRCPVVAAVVVTVRA